MTNDETWLTAAQAAKILRVTERQVNRYGADGRLRTQRAGRRVSYLASDVARLADELQVDKRPLPVPRQQGDGALISPQMARYIQEQSEAQKRTRNSTPSSIPSYACGFSKINLLALSSELLCAATGESGSSREASRTNTAYTSDIRTAEEVISRLVHVARHYVACHSNAPS